MKENKIETEEKIIKNTKLEIKLKLKHLKLLLIFLGGAENRNGFNHHSDSKLLLNSVSRKAYFYKYLFIL